MDRPRQSYNPGNIHVEDIQLSVSSITHPDGTPADMLDLDLGIVIRGNVTVPNQLTGTGHIYVIAQELGGPINQSIGSDFLDFAHTSAESGTTDYAWSVVMAPGSEMFSDSDLGLSHVFNVVVFFTHDQNREIAKYIDMGRYMIN